MDRLSQDDEAEATPALADRRPPHAVFRPQDQPAVSPSAQPTVAISGARLGFWFPLAVVMFYSLVIVGATYPRVMMARDTLPGYRVDPLQHLWVMNWYKSCLTEGKPHVYCPDIQYPTGAYLSNFSPMLLQSSLYIPLSLVLKNDILCYNILWFSAFVFSGFSIFVLAWSVLGNRWGATFAGLSGMLCTPMMLRGHGHLELMFAGSMSLFLAAWVAWVDRPSKSGLFKAAILYAITSLCAAYFAVFAVVPAVLYVAWRMVNAGRSGAGAGAWPWFRDRCWWFAGFLGLVIPALMLTFSAQIWAVSQGISMHRSLSEYERYGAPIWSYVLPTCLHAIYAVFPVNVYDPIGYPGIECAAYLGVVTLALMGYSAYHRVRFAGSTFWWLLFGSLALLSIGAYWRIGSHKVPLPGLWLRSIVPIFQAIRAPSRFNLLACGIAAVLAGSGLVRLLATIKRPWAKGVVFALAVVLTTADLSLVPFSFDTVRPAMPACYDWVKSRDPHAAILEAPVLSSGCNAPLTTTCAYWQSSHRLRTSAGYSGFPNAAFDDLLVDESPLSTLSLLNPESLARPDDLTVGIVPHMTLGDYAWMVAQRARFDYVLLHRWDDQMNERHPAFLKLAELLRGALVFEDPNTWVYDCKKLASPSRPVLFCEKGWRVWRERPGLPMRVVEKSAQIAVFIPEGVSTTVISIQARAYRHSRRVVLRQGEVELARWEIGPKSEETYTSPTLHLAAGMQELTLESDAEERPRNERDQAASWDARAYSLLVHRLEIIRAGEPVIGLVFSSLVVVASGLGIVVILHDGFEVMLLPRRVSRDLRLTRMFYVNTWRVWKALALRMEPKKRRKVWLGWFGPSSVILLFLVWALGLMLGFGLIHWGIGSPLTASGGQVARLGDYLYFSGVTFFTLGYGDLAPQTAVGRTLAVFEAGVGFAFLAVVISYLPVFYQSFARREVTISLLDARAGSPPTAGSLLLRLAPGRDPSVLDRFLQEWEHYAAEVLETHLSFPLLSYYRSQHDNQSWLAAMTMILDTCALTIAGLKNFPPYQAQLTFAMARHSVVDLCQVFQARPIEPEVDRLPPDRLHRLLDRLDVAGLPILDPSTVDARLVELRGLYEPFVNALSGYLLLDLPPICIEGQVVDNWQTSAWMKRTHGIGKLALADPGDDHDD